jgi:hypothetical protein
MDTKPLKEKERKKNAKLSGSKRRRKKEKTAQRAVHFLKGAAAVAARDGDPKILIPPRQIRL